MKTIFRSKNKYQSGQCGLEFIIGLAILILIIMGLIWVFSKLAVLIQDNFRDMQNPTSTPSLIVTPTSTDLQSPVPTVEPTTIPQPTSLPTITPIPTLPPTPTSSADTLWKLISLSPKNHHDKQIHSTCAELLTALS